VFSVRWTWFHQSSFSSTGGGHFFRWSWFAQIGRADLAFRQNGGHGVFHLPRGFAHLQMFEHHGALRIVARGLTIPFPAIFGAEPCTGSKHGGNPAQRIEDWRWGPAHAATMMAESRSECRRRDSSPPPRRSSPGGARNSWRRRRQARLGFDVGIFGGYPAKDAVPQNQAVALRVD